MEELVLPQLREIVGWYPVHGIFIDIAMMNPQGCFCPHCRERFRAETGRELTPGPEQRRFAAESMRRALRKIREAAGSLALCANASWGIGQPVEIADIVDFLVVESQPAHVSSGGYLLQMMQAKYCHADGRPFQIITVRFHGGGWGELSLKSREQLCYEFSLIAAHGGKVCCGDQGDYDGNLDAGTHRTLREAFDFVREREPFLGGRARRHIAVYCGEQGSFPFSVDELPPELPGMAGLLAGLNELPNAEGHLSADEALKAVRRMGFSPIRIHPLPEAKHIFSHIEWQMQGYLVLVEDADAREAHTPLGNAQELLFVEPSRTERDYPIPAAFAAYVTSLDILLGQEKFDEAGETTVRNRLELACGRIQREKGDKNENSYDCNSVL